MVRHEPQKTVPAPHLCWCGASVDAGGDAWYGTLTVREQHANIELDHCPICGSLKITVAPLAVGAR